MKSATALLLALLLAACGGEPEPEDEQGPEPALNAVEGHRTLPCEVREP